MHELCRGPCCRFRRACRDRALSGKTMRPAVWFRKRYEGTNRLVSALGQVVRAKGPTNPRPEPEPKPEPKAEPNPNSGPNASPSPNPGLLLSLALSLIQVRAVGGADGPDPLAEFDTWRGTDTDGRVKTEREYVSHPKPKPSPNPYPNPNPDQVCVEHPKPKPNTNPNSNPAPTPILQPPTPTPTPRPLARPSRPPHARYVEHLAERVGEGPRGTECPGAGVRALARSFFGKVPSLNPQPTNAC